LISEEIIPTFEPGAQLAPGLLVVGHRHRGPDTDLYDAWDEDRLVSCVAKIVRPDRRGLDRVIARSRAEGALLGELAHPNIVRCFGTHEVGADGQQLDHRPVVALEAIAGPSLHVLLHQTDARVAWPDLVTWTVQLCAALAYLHRRDVAHLDVKPANVVIGPAGAVLIDFHLAQKFGPVIAGRGTRRYLSPEQAEGGEATGASDIWGLGVTLFEAATGRAAFVNNAEDPAESTASAARGSYPQLDARAPAVRSLRALPAWLAEAIDACLHPDPARRPTAEQIMAHLQK